MTTTTRLYAVRRLIPHPQISGYTADLYLVYRPTVRPMHYTWTRSIAKASRWQRAEVADEYLQRVKEIFDLQDALEVLPV